MDDTTIEIRDDEINVEDIMAKIRENIRRRQAAGELPPDPDTLITAPMKDSNEDKLSAVVPHDFTFIHSNWNIHNNNYLISSHHSYIGKFLVRGRQLVHEEVRRFVDPMVFRQTEFNASIVRIITYTSQRCDELFRYQEQIEKAIFVCKQESDKTVSDSITAVKKDVDKKIDSISKTHAENLELIHYELNDLVEKYTTEVRSELNAETEARFQEERIIREERKNAIDQAILTHISNLREEFTEKLNRKVLTDKAELNPLIKKLDNLIHPDELHLNTLLEEGRFKIKEKVDARVKELFSQMEGDIDARLRIVHVLEERIQKELAQQEVTPEPALGGDTNYFLFEERFRGSREAIAQRQMAFLPYYEKCSRVLDIGCGRGEFLEILKGHNISGVGVDRDPDMVAYCRSRQLEVEQADAIAYLETLEDNSLEGVFIDQVVEHLEPGYLVRLLTLCNRKLKYGHSLVVETVNPLSFVSFVNFYIDMTHKRPVHPETLQYLFSVAGFRECEKKFFSPISDDSRLKKIERIAEMTEKERRTVDVYNHNVEILNSILFGAQDYAVIGKK